MFENEAQLHQAADEIVTQMLDDDIAQKKVYTDERLGKEYWNLVPRHPRRNAKQSPAPNYRVLQQTNLMTIPIPFT